MKQGFVFLVVLFVTSSGFSQHACNCSKLEAYVQKHDFDSTSTYKSENRLLDSWSFLSSKEPRCRAFGYHLLAEFQLSQFQYDAAKQNFEKEKYILDSVKCSPSAYLDFNTGMGDYFIRIGEFKSAEEHYSKALSMVAKTGNKSYHARILLSLSAVNSKLKNETRAFQELKQAHPFTIRLADNPRKVDNLLNLSARYYYHFQRTTDPSLLDSAQHAASFGLALAKRIGYTESFVRAYNLLEDKAYHDRNFRKALLYLDSALFYTKPNAQFTDRGGIFSDMSDIYLELKQYDKAYQFADSSLTYALKLANPYKVKDALELVYNCSKLSGEYERALSVYEDLVVMRDSVVKLQNQKAFSELEEKYHRVRKEKSESEYEQDRMLLEQQRQIGNLKYKLIAVGVVIFALLGFYLFMVFRQRKIKQRQNKLELQQRLNGARINPSFIYQTLSMLQSTENSADLTKKLNAFSKLIKQTLDSTFDDFLTLDKEIEFLSYYIDLQRFKNPELFDVQFDIDDAIDIYDVCLPTMILQPFVESTIEQGFKGLKHKGLLVIKCMQTPNQELVIRIQDNGRGLKALDSVRATEIINDRLYYLNKINKSSSSYIIRERQSGGVSVEIFLPLITKAYAEKLRNETL
jgi:tetratricopeptide (TPR) repeat protein